MAANNGQRNATNHSINNLTGRQHHRSDTTTRSSRDKRTRSEFRNRRNDSRVHLSLSCRCSTIRHGQIPKSLL